ncbi:DUF4328 domain-containing protein [Streptomyces sp. NBC_00820]|uniref:DUF4328 domain-containing protein n=1 Tax=Streptomyces sp. NBC_00820 TaxID=2975842 RepID=UPI002ED6687A|nr:DUF4328 domain-containing protein [Streptomyces sp. NBC_00820]
MSTPTVRALWPLARAAQAAIAVAAVADIDRVVTLRARLLHPHEASPGTAGLMPRLIVSVTFLAAVLFLVWFSRCRRNAELLSLTPLPGSAGWAVIAWLIPVVNLWVPRQLVLDVHGAPGKPEGRDRTLVNVWWAAWTGHVLVATAVTWLHKETSLVLLLVAETLELAAGALAIVVIQRVTARQAAASRALFPVPDAAHLPPLA